VSKKCDEPTESISSGKKIKDVRIPIKPIRVEGAKTMISPAAAGKLASGFPPLPRQNDLTFHGGKLFLILASSIFSFTNLTQQQQV